jgi:hypothetical protein
MATEDTAARACGRRFPFALPFTPAADLAETNDADAEVVEVVRVRARAVPLTLARTTSWGGGEGALVLAVGEWLTSCDESFAVTYPGYQWESVMRVVWVTFLFGASIVEEHSEQLSTGYHKLPSLSNRP